MFKYHERNKRNGFFGTFLFHLLLLISFFYLGLTFQDPPPAEEGINITFGINESGTKDFSNKEIKTESNIIEEKIENIEEQIENNEEIITQNIIETSNIENNDIKKIIKDKEPEIAKEEKKEVLEKALYPGKKNTKNNTKGKMGAQGYQGKIEGDENISSYTGAGTGNGEDMYQLGGRNVAYKAKPIYENQIEGTIVVIITVNRAGDVIHAIAGAKGSTTLNKQLLERAKNAALKTKFNAKKSAPTNQQGKIIYHFTLN